MLVSPHAEDQRMCRRQLSLNVSPAPIPIRLLDGWIGTLQADAYGGYNDP